MSQNEVEELGFLRTRNAMLRKLVWWLLGIAIVTTLVARLGGYVLYRFGTMAYSNNKGTEAAILKAYEAGAKAGIQAGAKAATEGAADATKEGINKGFCLGYLICHRMT